MTAREGSVFEPDSNSWEQRVANPEALGNAEKRLWTRIEPVLNSVLDEIRANGKIETVYVRAEMDRLGGPIATLEETSVTHNTLLHLFDESQEKWSKFLQATEQFGFKEANVIRMYMTMATAVTLLSTELFKLLLLFHMKDVSHDVSKFHSTMQGSAPKTWPLLKPFVDNDFRNAIAHGTYAVVNKRIVLYRDAKLLPFQEMELGEFMMRSKDQNVLFQCLVNVLVARKNSGFFS
jgi:hypothetical protein